MEDHFSSADFTPNDFKMEESYIVNKINMLDH